ncbi:MAG: DUF4174 domain-containing protein [Pseudomonadota bacterium]
MKFLAALAFIAAASPATANGSAKDAVALWQDDPARTFDGAELSLDDFKWQARPIVIFADSPLDPAFQTQLENLAQDFEELEARDVVVIVDTSEDLTDLRRKFRPRGFQLVLISKEGDVALRKPFPWDVRELSRAIDKMPIRQREISEGRVDGVGG